MLSYNSYSYHTSAKLVAVCTNKQELNEVKLDKRQIPLVFCDGLPTFIMQFDEIMSSLACEKQHNFSQKNELNNYLLKLKKDYEKFLQKYESINTYSSNKTNFNSHDDENKEINASPIDLIEAEPDKLISTINQLVPCIGCRSSVERLYKQLVVKQTTNKRFQKIGNLTLDPFLINQNGNLSLKRAILLSPMSIFKIFYINGPKLDTIIDSILKSKKNNRRCHLHSLDAQKKRSINDWLPVWDALHSDECKKKALIIESCQLLHTLNDYLNKHKFCSDCRMKVIRAFNILTGELDPSKEKGYSTALYEGLKYCCSSSVSSTEKQAVKKHIHVRNDKMFIANLISKAEVDIQGNKRELHAKTIDIAQEEVLTCVGIHLYERFHRICQTMRIEEQTWQLLYYTSVFTLKKCFELEFEKRQGFSDLDLICAEFLALDESRESRKQLKKERKKQKKQMSNEIKQRQIENETGNRIDAEAIKKDMSIPEENECECTHEKNESNDENEVVESIDGMNKEGNEECNEVEYDIKNSSSINPDLNNDDLSTCLQCDTNLCNTLSIAVEPDLQQSLQENLCECNDSSCASASSSDLSHLNSMHSSASSSSCSSASNCFNCLSLLDNIPSYIYDDFDNINNNEKFLSYFSNEDNDCFDCSLNSLMSSQNTDENNNYYITEEEKMEYQLNKSVYLTERLNRRELLKKQFQDLKLNSNFKLRPRNLS